MTLDVARLRAALDAHGTVARIVVAGTRGSAPRGAGTSMLVWEGGSDGTIGGGALEWRAMASARSVLATGALRVDRVPLGPALGQCCGGAVTLVTERLDAVPDLPWVRRVEGERPAPVMERFAFVDGWLREAASVARREVWIWGAGHVGAALAGVLVPLPEVAVTVVDISQARMAALPDGAAALVAADMPRAMIHASQHAEHLILTHSHDIDLALCHAALAHGFASCGLIGSATKRARFRSRLAALGHAAAEIDRIVCPIGDPALGKHPQAIAVGIAAKLLSRKVSTEVPEGTTA